MEMNAAILVQAAAFLSAERKRPIEKLGFLEKRTKVISIKS